MALDYTTVLPPTPGAKTKAGNAATTRNAVNAPAGTPVPTALPAATPAATPTPTSSGTANSTLPPASGGANTTMPSPFMSSPWAWQPTSNATTSLLNNQYASTLGALPSSPGNAFSPQDMQSFETDATNKLQTSQRQTQAGLAQGQAARGIAGPNAASTMGAENDAARQSALANMEWQAQQAGKTLGLQQYQAQTNAVGTLGNQLLQNQGQQNDLLLAGVQPSMSDAQSFNAADHQFNTFDQMGQIMQQVMASGQGGSAFDYFMPQDKTAPGGWQPYKMGADGLPVHADGSQVTADELKDPNKTNWVMKSNVSIPSQFTGQYTTAQQRQFDQTQNLAKWTSYFNANQQQQMTYLQASIANADTQTQNAFNNYQQAYNNYNTFLQNNIEPIITRGGRKSEVAEELNGTTGNKRYPQERYIDVLNQLKAAMDSAKSAYQGVAGTQSQAILQGMQDPTNSPAYTALLGDNWIQDLLSTTGGTGA